SVSIRNGVVYNNGKPLEFPERAKPQYSYSVTFDGKTSIDLVSLLRDLDVTDQAGFISEKRDILVIQSMTEEAAARLKNTPGIVSVTRNIETATEAVFPQNGKGNRDNMSPIYIPQEGKTVALTAESDRKSVV